MIFYIVALAGARASIAANEAHAILNIHMVARALSSTVANEARVILNGMIN